MGRRAMAPTIDGHVRSSRTRSAMFKGVALAVLAVVLAGCATGDVGTKTAIGGLGGAALGGLIAAAAGGGGTGNAAGVIGRPLVGGAGGDRPRHPDNRPGPPAPHPPPRNTA